MRGRMDKNGCSEKRSRQREALPARLKKDVENLRTHGLRTGARSVLGTPLSSTAHRGIALRRLFRRRLFRRRLFRKGLGTGARAVATRASDAAIHRILFFHVPRQLGRL